MYCTYIPALQSIVDVAARVITSTEIWSLIYHEHARAGKCGKFAVCMRYMELYTEAR